MSSFKNFFEELGKSRDKKDKSGRNSPVPVKPSTSDEANKNKQSNEKDIKPSTPIKDTITNNENKSKVNKEPTKSEEKIDKKIEIIPKTDEKKEKVDDKPSAKPVDKMNPPIEVKKELPPQPAVSNENQVSSLRLIDRAKQGTNDKVDDKSATSALINFLTFPAEKIKPKDIESPSTTVQSKEIKASSDTNKKESDVKSPGIINKQNEELNKIQPTPTTNQPVATAAAPAPAVEAQSKQNLVDNQVKTSSSTPQPSITTNKTQDVPSTDKISSQNLQPVIKNLSDTQNKSNIIVGKQDEIKVKTDENDKKKIVGQTTTPTVNDYQSTGNTLIPSNIPQPGTQVRLGKSGVITRSTDIPSTSNQPNINQQSNSPNLIITSDKGAKRSVIDQKEHQKYDSTQKPDPCRPTLFSAIDLKHSGFANAETIENCWNKLGVPDVEDLLSYLGFSKHGIINLDHLTKALHEALEMHTYDEPSVLAGIRSMNMELRLTDALKNAYEKEIEKLDKNLINEREVILRYFHQHLNEIRQKMDILFGQKEVEIKQIQQKLDKTVQLSHEVEIKNKEAESLLQTEDKFLNFITNLSDIMEAEIKQCEACKKDFDHFFVYNEKLKRTVDQVKNQAQDVNHFQRLRDSIQILKDYSQLLQIIVIKFAGIQRHTQFIINQEKEKYEKLEKTFENYQKNLLELQTTFDNLSRQNQKLINENEVLRNEIQSREAKIKSLTEENNRLNEKYQSAQEKINNFKNINNTNNNTNGNNTHISTINDDNKTMKSNGNIKSNSTTAVTNPKSFNENKPNSKEYPQPDQQNQNKQTVPVNSIPAISPDKNIITPYFMSKEHLAIRQYQNDLEETIKKQAKQIRQLRTTFDNLSRQNQKLINENEVLRNEIQSREAKIKSLTEENNRLNEKYQSAQEKINNFKNINNTNNNTNGNNTHISTINDDNKTMKSNGNIKSNSTTAVTNPKSFNENKPNSKEYPQPDQQNQNKQTVPVNSIPAISPDKNIITPYFMSKEHLAIRQYQNDLEETIKKQAKQIRQLRIIASKYGGVNDYIRTDIVATRDQ
ncbi:unnamed protein product [Trichobilharzia szidati]|nr:unnamed protein product [Trichobilharzia szidati]